MQTVTHTAPWAMNSNNPHGFYKVGVFDQLTITHGFRQRTVCVRPPCTNASTQRTVWDVHTYGNDFLGFTVWDVHTYGNDFWDSPCGMYIPTKMIYGIHRVGCTYLRKWFSRITVWDVHTYGNDWVSMPRPISHGPRVGPRRAYPRRFLGRVGRTPLSPTLTWRWFQMPSRKGVLNRLYSTDAYQCPLNKSKWNLVFLWLKVSWLKI